MVNVGSNQPRNLTVNISERWMFSGHFRLRLSHCVFKRNRRRSIGRFIFSVYIYRYVLTCHNRGQIYPTQLLVYILNLFLIGKYVTGNASRARPELGFVLNTCLDINCCFCYLYNIRLQQLTFHCFYFKIFSSWIEEIT